MFQLMFEKGCQAAMVFFAPWKHPFLVVLSIALEVGSQCSGFSTDFHFFWGSAPKRLPTTPENIINTVGHNPFIQCCSPFEIHVE